MALLLILGCTGSFNIGLCILSSIVTKLDRIYGRNGSQGTPAPIVIIPLMQSVVGVFHVGRYEWCSSILGHIINKTSYGIRAPGIPYSSWTWPNAVMPPSDNTCIYPTGPWEEDTSWVVVWRCVG